MVRVVIVGATGMDTNIYLDDFLISSAREARFTQNMDVIGQAGGYATLGYHSLGYDTGLIDFIGNDYHGHFIKATFEELGIKTLWQIDPAGTRRSVNFVFPDGSRKAFYDAKSAMTLHPNISQSLNFIETAELLHFNINNWARYLLEPFKQTGKTIAVDLQDVIDSDDTYRHDFIKHADIVFFSSANIEDPVSYINQNILQFGEKIWVCGMGQEGVLVYYQGQYFRKHPVNLENHPVIDTNGAGDSLAVGFLSSFILDQEPIDKAIERGLIAARWACGLKATNNHLLSREKLQYLKRVCT